MMLALDFESSPGRPVLAAEPDLGSLLARIGRGDAHALADLYDRTSRIVYSLALRMLGDTADAEEVSADVYNQVWRTARQYTPDRGSPITWLIMITRSRSLDRLRLRDSRRQRETTVDQIPDRPGDAASAEESAVLEQRAKQVRKALGALPAEQRQALELSFFNGLTHTELADRLGEPLGTVKTRIRTAIARLRAALKDEPGVAQ